MTLGGYLYYFNHQTIQNKNNLERKDFPYKHYLCLFYFHLFNILLRKVKNVEIVHEIDKKRVYQGVFLNP
jgi:hypothetical protein